MDISELGNMIRERRESLQMSMRKLGDLIGASATHVSNIEHGYRGVSLGLLRRIESALQFQQGELTLHAPASSAFEVGSEDFPPPPNGYIGVPISPFLQAKELIKTTIEGQLKKAVSDDSSSRSLDYLPVEMSASAEAFAIQVADDDLSPMIREGDILFIDPKKEVRSGDFVLVDLDGQYVIRRYTHDGTMRCLDGINERIGPQHLRYDDMRTIIGPVISLRRHFR